MKKVHLTEEEKKQVEVLMDLSRKVNSTRLEYEKTSSDFWYSFQKRMCGGNFSLDVKTGEMWEKTFEESVKENNSKTK